MRSEFCVKTVTIASGQTTSPTIDLLGLSLVAIVMPHVFTGTKLTFTAVAPVNDGNGNFSEGSSPTYLAVVDAGGTAMSVKAAIDQYVLVDQFMGGRFIRLVSDATEAQADILTLILKPTA